MTLATWAARGYFCFSFQGESPQWLNGCWSWQQETWGRESELDVGEDVYSQSPFSVTYSSNEFPLTKIPITYPNGATNHAEDHAFKYLRYGGHFSFKQTRFDDKLFAPAPLNKPEAKGNYSVCICLLYSYWVSCIKLYFCRVQDWTPWGTLLLKVLLRGSHPFPKCCQTLYVRVDCFFENLNTYSGFHPIFVYQLLPSIFPHHLPLSISVPFLRVS